MSTTNAGSAWSLHRDAFGQLAVHWADGRVTAPVTPVRHFPLSSPAEGFSLVDAAGHEVLCLTGIAELSASDRHVVEDALAVREFMPVITRIRRVSSFNTPSTWTVDTEQGERQLTLKGEEHIRRLAGGGGRLLIADSHGLQFLIPDFTRLDRHSLGLLNRFL